MITRVQTERVRAPILGYRAPTELSRPALVRLLRDGLVQLGDYEPLKGRPVHVTDLRLGVLEESCAAMGSDLHNRKEMDR